MSSVAFVFSGTIIVSSQESSFDKLYVTFLQYS